MKIAKTQYDGYYVVDSNGKLKAYEGYDLCPRKVQEEIDKHHYEVIACFFMEAIKYGYI